MAKLKLRIPALETVDESLRGYYREQEGGGFMLDHEQDPDGYGIDNLAALRGKLNDAIQKKQKTEGNLLKKESGELWTLAEIQALQAEMAEKARLAATLQDKDKSAQEKFAARLAEERKPLLEKLTKAESDREVYRGKVVSAEQQRVVDQLVKELNPLPEWEGMLRRELRAHVQIEEAEGQMQHRIVDPESGEPRFSQLTGVDGPMGIKEFAGSKIIRDEFGQCLNGDGKEGAGPIRNSQNGGGQNRTGGKLVLPAEHSQKQFEAAYQEANKQGVELVIEGDGQ